MVRPLQLHDRKGGSCVLIQQRLERKRVAVRTWLLSAAQRNTASNKHVTYQAGEKLVILILLGGEGGAAPPEYRHR